MFISKNLSLRFSDSSQSFSLYVCARRACMHACVSTPIHYFFPPAVSPLSARPSFLPSRVHIYPWSPAGLRARPQAWLSPSPSLSSPFPLQTFALFPIFVHFLIFTFRSLWSAPLIVCVCRKQRKTQPQDFQLKRGWRHPESYGLKWLNSSDLPLGYICEVWYIEEKKNKLG